MFALRKSALETWNFSKSSQVFFNNRIIEARLLKPDENVYVLSILNISSNYLKLSLTNNGSLYYTPYVNILGTNISFRGTMVNPGCYLDIRFSFRTNNLNFRFLPFSI
jgi:hypothetical protein